ncbi:rhomboid family intramembrane serine protease [Rhodocyclus tenuis]|uniref:rhomboid family intramembrane serine protease n=1 Tax=Rhodocyclus tenuis TaxID=1066 RepID=UPI00190414FE|nr:rhomboid family intramembrane serine protease [Rhodocyclus tenuis]MBK1678927.1 rhomboid family intramembrane serine protease [Rhodocyclus tenuis]
MPEIALPPSLQDQLRLRQPVLRVTPLLIGINVLVFLAMLANGAGVWHSPNGVQLAWGANFGPATQDGQWWRLASAMFLHFGVLHLLLNMWALWDSGQFVERFYGYARFAAIYFISGVSGNLLSLVAHQGQAVSGGASGAIFGVYGALLVCLWHERQFLQPSEFRWLFWGAAGFAALTIVFGLLVEGIDNAAHIGGFIAGVLSGTVLLRTLRADLRPIGQARGVAALALAGTIAVLVSLIPPPAYRWHDELRARQEISEFLKDDAAIGESWRSIVKESKRGDSSFDELAGRIDAAIGDRYAASFEQLSQAPDDPALPSAATLAALRQYAQTRRDASRSLAESLRRRDASGMAARPLPDANGPGQGFSGPGKGVAAPSGR